MPRETAEETVPRIDRQGHTTAISRDTTHTPIDPITVTSTIGEGLTMTTDTTQGLTTEVTEDPIIMDPLITVTTIPITIPTHTHIHTTTITVTTDPIAVFLSPSFFRHSVSSSASRGHERFLRGGRKGVLPALHTPASHPAAFL